MRHHVQHGVGAQVLASGGLVPSSTPHARPLRQPPRLATATCAPAPEREAWQAWHQQGAVLTALPLAQEQRPRCPRTAVCPCATSSSSTSASSQRQSRPAAAPQTRAKQVHPTADTRRNGGDAAQPQGPAPQQQPQQQQAAAVEPPAAQPKLTPAEREKQHIEVLTARLAQLLGTTEEQVTGSPWFVEAKAVPGFLKRLRGPIVSPKRPTWKGIVIVEGILDCAAVQRAINALVYVCDGSSIKSGQAQADLELLASWPEAGLIVLTDPDAPGRELRMHLDEQLVQQALQGGQPQRAQRVKHAFISVQDATATADTKWHKAGSTGVENAHPRHVQQSLRRARHSHPKARKEFEPYELQQRGLVNTFDSKQVQGAKLRRKLLCDRLGIDPCTGQSLVSVLNRFFTREEFEEAMAALPAAKAE